MQMFRRLIACLMHSFCNCNKYLTLPINPIQKVSIRHEDISAARIVVPPSDDIMPSYEIGMYRVWFNTMMLLKHGLQMWGLVGYEKQILVYLSYLTTPEVWNFKIIEISLLNIPIFLISLDSIHRILWQLLLIYFTYIIFLQV